MAFLTSTEWEKTNLTHYVHPKRLEHSNHHVSSDGLSVTAYSIGFKRHILLKSTQFMDFPLAFVPFDDVFRIHKFYSHISLSINYIHRVFTTQLQTYIVFTIQLQTYIVESDLSHEGNRILPLSFP